MSEQNNTWIVVADGARARIFEERVRLGPLQELAGRAMRQEGVDQQLAVHPKATGGSRAGSRRHNVNEASPHKAAETNFLHRVADMLDLGAQGHLYSSLILVAPPHALGELRAALKEQTLRKVEASDPHERTGEDAETLRRHLSGVRKD